MVNSAGRVKEISDRHFRIRFSLSEMTAFFELGDPGSASPLRYDLTGMTCLFGVGISGICTFALLRLVRVVLGRLPRR